MYSWVFFQVLRRGYTQMAAGRPELLRLAADDFELVFPGESVFGGRYKGKAAVEAWMRRFAALQPKFEVLNVTAGGPPWNTRVAVRFRDAIGDDYANEGMELISIRWGRAHSVQVFLDTETVTSWEARHPELAAVGS